MFWGVVMEECHCLFVRKEARQNWPLAISCSSFCLNENRQAKTAQGTSDEKQCKESYSSGLQYGARNNIQQCAIIVCFTCMEFMHCVWLFFVSFFTAGPVMVVRVRHSPEISHHSCSASSGSQGVWADKGKAQQQGSVGQPEEVPEWSRGRSLQDP